MRIDSDPSHDALALAVTKAAFLRSAIGGLGTNKRDLVVTAGLKGTDPQTGSDLGSLSPLKIEGISQGYNKNFVDNAFSESGQRPIVRGPRTKWMANPLNANAQAYIVTADVAETRRGNQVFAEIAEALETAQPGVIQAAKQAIDPAAREQARAARREQRKTARDTYDEQLAAAIVAVNACETMTDASLAVRIEKAKNAALAQRSANEAAIEAGERVPFPDPISLASFIDAEEAQDVGC